MKARPKSIPFHELSAPTFLQTVRAVGGCLDRALHSRGVPLGKQDVEGRLRTREAA